MTRRGWALFAAMSVIWGVPYLLIRVAVRDLSPATLVFARTAPAALVLVPLAARRGDLGPLLARWRWIVAFTAVELGVPWLLLARAEQRVDSSTAGLLIAGVPLVAAIAYRRSGSHEPLTPRRLTGLLVGLAGVGVLLGVDVGRTDPWAVAELAVVVVGYALGPLIINRRLADLPSLGVVGVSMALCALAYLPWAVTHLPRRYPAEVSASVAGLALVCSALAFVLFFALIAEIGPSRATVITYVNPAVAVLLGVAVLGEPLTVGLAVGFPLILLGSVLATGPAPDQPANDPMTSEAKASTTERPSPGQPHTR